MDLSIVWVTCVAALMLYVGWYKLVDPALERLHEMREQQSHAAPRMPVSIDEVLLPASYVSLDVSTSVVATPVLGAFERPERPAFVQALNSPNVDGLTYDELIMLDTLARLLAAKLVSESSALVAVFDGVDVVKLSKGGSSAYTQRRDMLRELAARHGWVNPQSAVEQHEPRLVAVSDGRLGYVALDD